MNLAANVVTNYQSLLNNFIGISINIQGIFHFLFSIFLVLSLFTLFYFLGDKIRRNFFRDIPTYTHFINFALGYIIFGTGIGILGLFSLFYPLVIVTFLVLVIIIAFYPPLPSIFVQRRLIFMLPKVKKKSTSKNFLFLAVGIFVTIAFLRLMTPEIAEDGYHTDLPTLYLSWHTTIHESKDLLRVIPYPQLPEMTYVIPIVFGQKEAARFLHFGFYLLIISLLFKLGKDYPVTKFSPLLFVTAPLVIRYSPTQYTDFFAVYCFLLSVLGFNKISNKKIILSGILLGAVISTKIWMLVYLPALLLFGIIISKKYKLLQVMKMSLLFIASSLTVSLLWQIRAYVITGNPIFPLFSKWYLLGESEPVAGSIMSFLGFNIKMLSVENLVVYSPLFFVGIIFILPNIKKFITLEKKNPLFLVVLILMLEQLIIQVYLGRYLLTLYTIATLVVSGGLIIILKNKLYRYLFIFLYVIIVAYYAVNTMLILPYGFGWADKNSYLSLVLGRDNISYYDFDHLFDKWISKDDLVATYGIGSFYYANFSYIDMGYVFDNQQRSFSQFKRHNVTKIFIKGGDIEWFSKKISMTDFDKKRVKLLATYPADTKKYNLYSIEK